MPKQLLPYLIACCVITEVSAAAEEKNASTEKHITLDEMTVTTTATKTEITAAEAPATVRIVNRDKINERRVNRLGDAMREIPGLYLMGSVFGDQASGTNRATTTIRGIQGGNRALFMLDGQSLNNAQTGSANLSAIVMDDVERIDFVPGPFSSLYGSYALSGVMNILTKTPDKREFKFRTSGGGGQDGSSPDQWNIAGIYRDRFKNGLGISIGGNFNQSFGYTNSYLIKTATPSANAVGATRVTGAVPTVDIFSSPAYQLGDVGASTFGEGNAFAKLYYDFSPNTHAMIGYSFFRSEVSADEPYSTYLRNNLNQPVSSGNLVFNDNGFKRLALRETEFSTTPSNEEISRYFTRFDHKFDNDLSIKADFSFQDRTIDTALYSTTAVTANFNGGPGELQALPTDQRINGKLEFSYPFYSSALPDWLSTHNLVAGFDASQDDMHRIRYNLSNWRDMGSQTQTIYDASGTSNTYGVYLQDEWMPHEQVSVYLGGRVDNWRSTGKVQQFAPLLAYQRDYEERTFTQFSPKGALVYKPFDNLVLKGSAGLSFRPPTTFDLYTTSVANSNRFGILSRVTTEASPNLKPEQAFSWEIGAETSFDTGTNVNFTYFETQLTDLFYGKDIVTGTANDVRQTSNTGKAEIFGVEAALRQKIIEDISFFGNISYAKTKITENQGDPTTVGKELTRAPKLMWNLGVEGKYKDFSGSLIGRVVGKSYNDAANRDTARGVSGAWDAFYLLDGKIGYEIIKGVKTNFSVQNILDEKKYQSSQLAGRTFIGEVAFQF